ncbi:fatty-acyl-CoA synthase [Dongia mobilis]|uniref:3-methylmercaptopropionyl-CoA ligase n=1 Tax=Dongia mobilis TaxID=578943 RepID=A0A4V3DF01_9PROT|nr:AMP-binding protein [Dongia mobilis]TDQ84151.1 fatty-acyl-CoA synthase [Dongia mobilis]
MQDPVDFPRNAANFVPLSPLSFLTRAAEVFPGRVAVIYGKRRHSWLAIRNRAAALASALRRAGIRQGDVVAMMAANTPELFEAHFGVPLSGAVLNTLNTRLDAETIAYILDHGGARLLFTDSEFAPVMKKALGMMQGPRPRIIDIVDPLARGGQEAADRLGDLTYDDFLATGDAEDPWEGPADEWQSLSLNYTSGTSGRPKGVLYHHRGAYLMSLGTVVGWGLPLHPRYLYTVPMFHCNGWGHAWTLALVAGTAVLQRYVAAKSIFAAIEEHRITHLGGAPVVLGMLANAPDEERRPLAHGVKVMTAGAPPPSAILARMAELGFEVMQVYGLTETFGHVVHCAWHEEWNGLPFADQAEIKARQGVRFPITEEIRVVDPETGAELPSDGRSMGEVVIRGNTVMKGYHRDPAATEKSFFGGYFHSGDLAVRHSDGYIEVKDRLKDVIISGGENVSSIEIESRLYKHPAVAVAAVVAKPDPKWGEVPCAFVELKPGQAASEADLIAFCRESLAGFKTPKRIVFGDVPKTSTGKIQKFELRDRAKTL